jgi:hypothetical protein
MDSLINNLLWIEELLPPDIQMIPKNGGQGYILGDRLVLILVEHPDSVYEHKGVTYPFDLWKGCIFPIEQKKQSAFFLKYLFLENHPQNKDWLYIPAESEHFEDEVKQMLREISKRNPLLGTPLKFSTLRTAPTASSAKPGGKKKKATKRIKADKKRENNFVLSMVNRTRK